MKISELILKLEKVRQKHGDLRVVTENNPYMDNQWAFDVYSEPEVRENPEYVIFTPRYRNPSHKYKGKLVYL